MCTLFTQDTAMSWYNPKVSRDGRFMKFCCWLDKSHILPIVFLTTFSLWLIFALITGQKIYEQQQQIKKLDLCCKKAPKGVKL